MNNEYNLEVDDPTFVEDLKGSIPSIWAAAKLLWSKGLSVQLPPVYIRPNIEDRHKYSDNGDLFLLMRIEVKQRELDFHSIESFPFSTVLIESVSKYKRKKQKPYLYIIWNREQTHCLFVKVKDTFKHWTKKKVYDSKKKRWELSYECPVKYCTLETVAA